MSHWYQTSADSPFQYLPLRLKLIQSTDLPVNSTIFALSNTLWCAQYNDEVDNYDNVTWSSWVEPDRSKIIINLRKAAKHILGRLPLLTIQLTISTSFSHSFSQHFEVACSLKSDKSHLDSATLQQITSPEASGSTVPKSNNGKVRISTHVHTCTQNVVNTNTVRRVTIDTLYIAIHRCFIHLSPVLFKHTMWSNCYL